MIDKIRAYIDHAFLNAPNTKKVAELKEELLANLIEKYNDQLLHGKSEVEAYNNAVSGIGDISELIESLKTPNPLAMATREERKKYALCVSISVGLYIVSAFTVPIFAINFQDPFMGIMVMFIIIAFATSLIIYANIMKPKYTRANDTVVEDFKEWRCKNERERAAFKSFSGAYWSLVTAVYLMLSFTLRIWSFSWIIFIIAAAFEAIIKGIMQLRGDDDEQ